MRIVKKYWLPLLALVLAIGLAVWRIGYLERTNTSLSMEIGSRKALQNGEPITLENPVVLYKNEPYVPLKEIVERLGGTTDGKTYTLHGAETAVSGVERNGVHAVFVPVGQPHSADTVGQKPQPRYHHRGTG